METNTPVVIDVGGGDIHAEGMRIREAGPVTRIELPGGVLGWSIAGYAVARQVLADPRFSKDARRHWTAYANGQIAPDFPLITWARMENLTTSHGDSHSRQRRLIAKAFSPLRTASLRPNIARLVDRLLTDIEEREPGEVVDLKSSYALPLAAHVIGDLIGIPDDARVGILPGTGASTYAPTTPAEAAAAFAKIQQDIAALVEQKRRQPTDDLTSDLLAAQEDDGSRLTETELTSTLLLLLNTGTEPVMNLICNAIFALLTHPDQLDSVRSDTIPWSAAIEEVLRVEAPVAHLPFRFAVEDVEVGGVTIPAGEPILMNFAAAGRDPAVHGSTADRFDVTRPGKKHVSFGHGIYRCVGSSLAWLETEMALRALFERFIDVRLAVPADQLSSQGTFIMNGLSTLPVRLRRAAHPLA